MAMNLGLEAKDKQTLMNELKNSEEYEKIQNKMRAGVILCAQELMNETQHSQLEKFNTDIPEDKDVEMAIALINDYFKSRKLNLTAQTLTDELEQSVFENGEKEAKQLSSKLSVTDNLLSTITAGAID